VSVGVVSDALAIHASAGWATARTNSGAAPTANVRTTRDRTGFAAKNVNAAPMRNGATPSHGTGPGSARPIIDPTDRADSATVRPATAIHRHGFGRTRRATRTAAAPATAPVELSTMSAVP
jgi:hypothetical protein